MNSIHLRLIFIGLFILCIFAPPGSAQYRISAPEPTEPPPSVLYPEPTFWYIGILLGADINRHSGDFYTVLCERTFNDAEGEGIFAGAQLEHLMSDGWLWVLRLAYNDYSGDASYMVKNLPTQVDDGTIVNIDHTYRGKVTLSYLSINPMIEFNPFGGLYVFAGPAAGFLMTGKYQCLDEVPEEWDFVRTEETSAQEDDIDIPNSNGFRLDLRAGIGYNLRLSRAVTLTPEVGYIYGITKISDDDDWVAHAYSAIAILKFDL